MYLSGLFTLLSQRLLFSVSLLHLVAHTVGRVGMRISGNLDALVRLAILTLCVPGAPYLPRRMRACQGLAQRVSQSVLSGSHNKLSCWTATGKTRTAQEQQERRSKNYEQQNRLSLASHRRLCRDILLDGRGCEALGGALCARLRRHRGAQRRTHYHPTVQ